MEHKAYAAPDKGDILERQVTEIIELAAWRRTGNAAPPQTKLSTEDVISLLNDQRGNWLVAAAHPDQARSIGSVRIGVLRPDQLFALINLGLADEVANSESLLALEDDWDGMGSPVYAEETWRRAVVALLAIASHLQDHYHGRLGVVEILPGSYGNIDIEMHAEKRMLFLSVPVDQGLPARYYGHDSTRRNVTKGTLDLRAGCQWLAGWLARE